MIELVILMFSYTAKTFYQKMIYRGFGGVKRAVYQQGKDKSKEKKKNLEFPLISPKQFPILNRPSRIEC